METVCEDLKDVCLKNDDEARSCIVRAAELGVINSCDILPAFREFKSPSHVEFKEPTRWSLMNATDGNRQKVFAPACRSQLPRLEPGIRPGRSSGRNLRLNQAHFEHNKSNSTVAAA